MMVSSEWHDQESFKGILIGIIISRDKKYLGLFETD